MARFNTIMIETGVAEVAPGSGTKTVILESPFLSSPAIYIVPGTTEDDLSDPGSATVASWNVNAYVSGLGRSSGAWTFIVNTEETPDENGAGADAYKNVKVAWRAIGPVPAT